MFFNFEPNVIEKYLWESGFSNFGYVTFSQNKNLCFGCHFETKHFWCFFFFCWYIVVLGLNTYGASFVRKFLWESSQKWLGPSRPPCAQTKVKSSNVSSSFGVSRIRTVSFYLSVNCFLRVSPFTHRMIELVQIISNYLWKVSMVMFHSQVFLWS